MHELYQVQNDAVLSNKVATAISGFLVADDYMY